MMALAHVVTASRTLDGAVAYLRPDGRFGPRLDEAWLFADAAGALEARDASRGREAEVCDPYVIEVELSDAGPRPRSARERIRADGPEKTLLRLGYAA